MPVRGARQDGSQERREGREATLRPLRQLRAVLGGGGAVSGPRALKCARCGSEGSAANPLSEHHVYPKRHAVKGHFDELDKEERNKTVTLCRRSCHDQIERLIHQYEGGKPLHWTFYAKLVRDFCRRLTPAA